MKLSNKVAPTVPVPIRDRGTALYRQGAVYIYRGNPLEVHASVRGTRLYPVSLTREDQRLNVVCGCPYFDEHTAICKHIWATLLASDAAGYLADDADLDGDLEPGLTKNPLTDVELSAAMDSFLQQSRSHVRKELWLSQLRSIQSAQERLGPEKPWPAQREILYVIDAAATSATGELNLDIVYREPKKDGSWGKPKPVPISPKVIGQLPDARDRQIFSMTLGTSDPWVNSYGYYGYGRDRSIPGSDLTVPTSIADAIVPLIGATGRGRLLGEDDEHVAVRMDDGPAWELLARRDGRSSHRHLLGGRQPQAERRSPHAAESGLPAARRVRGMAGWDRRLAQRFRFFRLGPRTSKAGQDGGAGGRHRHLHRTPGGDAADPAARCAGVAQVCRGPGHSSSRACASHRSFTPGTGAGVWRRH